MRSMAEFQLYLKGVQLVVEKGIKSKVFSFLPSTMSCEPTYTRGGKVWPVVSTAASTELRSLLLSNEYSDASIAEATVKLQLRTWEKAEAAALAQVKEKGLGRLLDVDLDAVAFQGELGEHPAADVDAIFDAISLAAGNTSLRKDIWTWERLPFVIRCVGLARSSDDKVDSSSPERPTKKARTQGRDELALDLDEWYVMSKPCLLVDYNFIGSSATRSSFGRSLGALLPPQTLGSLAWSA